MRTTNVDSTLVIASVALLVAATFQQPTTTVGPSEDYISWDECHRYLKATGVDDDIEGYEKEELIALYRIEKEKYIKKNPKFWHFVLRRIAQSEARNFTKFIDVKTEYKYFIERQNEREKKFRFKKTNAPMTTTTVMPFPSFEDLADLRDKLNRMFPERKLPLEPR